MQQGGGEEEWKGNVQTHQKKQGIQYTVLMFSLLQQKNDKVISIFSIAVGWMDVKE